jgi:hypothetical protein
MSPKVSPTRRPHIRAEAVLTNVHTTANCRGVLPLQRQILVGDGFELDGALSAVGEIDDVVVDAEQLGHEASHAGVSLGEERFEEVKVCVVGHVLNIGGATAAVEGVSEEKVWIRRRMGLFQTSWANVPT